MFTCEQMIHKFFFGCIFFRKGLRKCWVNHDVKMIYCPIPKAACTSLRLFTVLTTDVFRKRYPNVTAQGVDESIYKNKMVQCNNIHNDYI